MSGAVRMVSMVVWLLALSVVGEEVGDVAEDHGHAQKLIWRCARPEKMWRIHSQIYHEMEALAQDPTDVQLYSRIEVVCKNNEEPNSRFRLLATILRLDPSLRDTINLNRGYALGDRLYLHAKACRLEERERDFHLWLNMWNSGVWDPMLLQGHALPVLPFYALVFPFDMSQVFKSCVGWAEKFGSYTSREALPKPFLNVFWKEFRETGVIKIGYISSDVYRIHPVGKSINAVLRMHDQRQFEVCNITKMSEQLSACIRQVYAFLLIPVQLEHAERLENGTGGVLLSDISILSSAEGASTINDEGIHILIDLNGHTSGVRMEIFAYGPAPIVMHYMGFGATTGASYVHYFLADTAVSTPELSVYYTEKMAYLPATFYANSYRYDQDRLPYVRRNETYRDEREKADLPPDGVVLCNFNHLHKTSRAMWSLWAQILLRNSQSREVVLWTLNDSEETKGNIAKELRLHGVDENRVRYAPHEKIWQHLIQHRHALADIFLDNNEYNGGTTGLDSYWAGVPIISAPQEKFSARYGASFNRGARTEILTARNGDDYVKIASKLVERPALIQDIRSRLEDEKTSTAGMFDMDSFMQRYQVILKKQWDVFWSNVGEDGEQQGPRKMHIVFSGAGRA